MSKKEAQKVDTSRRRALTILGLTAAAAYAVPVLMTLKSSEAKDGISSPSMDSPANSPEDSRMDSPQDSLAYAQNVDS